MPSSEEYAPSVEIIDSDEDEAPEDADGNYSPSPPAAGASKRKSTAASTQPRKRQSGGAPPAPALEILLKTASRAQLMRVVETLAEEFPGVESRAIAQLQEVNIDELRGRFFELANAAQKGLPRYANGDKFSLMRVKALLGMFKKEVLATVKTFVDAKSWAVLPDIVGAALDAVSNLPTFDRVPEGTAGLVAGPMRKSLAKTLAKALKGAKASAAECKKWQERLKHYGLENEIK